MAIYVLAAAVNLGTTIFDGNDLSVIRGSSARARGAAASPSISIAFRR